MLVSQILKDKGGAVISVAPDVSIATALSVLAERRIGAVLALADDGAIAGILSERDIVRALARDGAAALLARVDAYMTRHVTTCTEQDTVCEIMESMTRGRFRHLPVTRDGQLAGIVSIGDVVKSRIAETEGEAQALREYIATG